MQSRCLVIGMKLNLGKDYYNVIRTLSTVVV
jgi:hypothetical protein